MNLFRLTPLIAFLGAPLSIHAASVQIVNSGFEDISDESPFNEFTFGPLNGWDLYDPGNVTSGGAGPQFWIGTLTPTAVASTGSPDPQFFPGGAPEGSRVGIAYNVSGAVAGEEYGLSQTLSATLQANTVYTLSALIGNIANGRDVSGNDYIFDGFPGYRIDLLAGSTLLATVQTTDPGSIPEGEFGLAEYQYTTGANDALLGQLLTIRLVNLNQIDDSFSSSDREVDFDDIRLSAIAIPEPSSLALSFSLAIPLLARRRRQ